MKKTYISQSDINFKHEYFYDVPYTCQRLSITNKQYNKWNTESACWFVIADEEDVTVILNINIDFKQVEFFTI